MSVVFIWALRLPTPLKIKSYEKQTNSTQPQNTKKKIDFATGTPQKTWVDNIWYRKVSICCFKFNIYGIVFFFFSVRYFVEDVMTYGMWMARKSCVKNKEEKDFFSIKLSQIWQLYISNILIVWWAINGHCCI